MNARIELDSEPRGTPRGNVAVNRGAAAWARGRRLPARSSVGPAVAVSGTPTSPFRGVAWTPTLIGFLVYLLVMTSNRIPVGDVAVAMALVGVVLQGRDRRFPPYLVWLTVFSLWAWAASSWTEYPEWVAPQLIGLLKLCLIVLVAANATRTRPQVRLFMVFFLGCFALFPLRGAFSNYFIYDHNVEGRAIWNFVYSNPNDLAAIALLQLSMALALLVSEPKGWVRWCAMGGAILVPMLILMTQSRGVFLGLIVFTAIVFTGQRRRLRLALRIGAVALVLAAAAPTDVWDRLGTLQQATSTSGLDELQGDGGSARQRYEIWRVASSIIRDHPITGVGVAAYEPTHEEYAVGDEFNPTAQGRRDTHSLYLNVLAETGYPGFFLYLGMLATVFIAVERTRRKCKKALPVAARQLLILEAGLVGFLVAAVFASLPYLAHFLLHLVLLYSASAIYRKELKAARGQVAAPVARRGLFSRRTAAIAAGATGGDVTGFSHGPSPEAGQA